MENKLNKFPFIYLAKGSKALDIKEKNIKSY